MINFLLKPQLNLLDVLIYALLFGLYVKDFINTSLFILLCIVSGVVGAVVQNHFYKENK